MKMLVLGVAVLGLLAFTGPAFAGGGCEGSMKSDRTAETPPPPPPPYPST